MVKLASSSNSTIGILEAKKLAEIKLLKEAGISGIGLSGVIGYNSPEHINIYVEYPAMLKRIPRDIAGHPTKGVLTGKLYALPYLQALAVNRLGRVRPAVGGVSIGHFEITAGTFGTVVYKGALRYILSNNHVLANGNKGKIGDPIWQPGEADGGTASDTLTKLAQFIPIKFGENDENDVDCALAGPVSAADASDEIDGIGVVTGRESAQINMQVMKSGRNGIRQAAITDISATVKVGYGDGEATFSNQIMTSHLGDPGDSGSLVVNKGTNKAVGLLFAGSNLVTVCNKIELVQKALGFTFSPGGEPPGGGGGTTAQAAFPWIVGLGIAGAALYSVVKKK